MGLSDKSLDFYIKNNWIIKDDLKELKNFREYIDGIEDWDIESFKNNKDWQLAKDWAIKLFNKFGMIRKGWDSSGSNLIYVPPS